MSSAKSTKTTRTAPWFVLGSVVNGHTYIYSTLGTFSSAAAAVEFCQEKGATVFRKCGLVRHGVEYGHSDYEAVAVAVGR